MATERVELELAVAGGASAVAAIQAEERALADLQKQLQSGVITFATFESESDKVIERLNELRTATAVTEDVLRGLGEGTEVVTASMGRVAASKEKAATASANLRTSIVATSYAIQDFSSTTGDLGAKLNSISNNIPQILVGLGGIGTALSVGATAAIAFYRNWDSIKSIFVDVPFEFGKATNSLTELRDRIKELEGKKVKVGAEYDELEKAKETAKELVRALELAEEIRTGQAKAERESGARIKAAIAEAPGGGAAVVSALAAPREAELRAQAEAQAKREEAALEERARRAVEMELPLDPRVIEAEWNAIQSRWGARLKGIAAEAETQVGQLLSTAIKGTGEEQARAQEALRRGLAGAGQAALAERIGGLGPMQVQGMETQEQVEKQAKLRDQQVKQAAEAFDRQTEALNKQGEHQERLGREDEARKDKQEADERRREFERDARERERREAQVQAQVGRLAEQSGLMDRAQRYAAELRARGATPAQEEAILRRRFQEELQMSAPGLNPLQRRGAASGLAIETRRQLDQKLIAAQQTGQNATQALLNVSAMLDAQVQRMAQQQDMLWRQSQELQRRVAGHSRAASMGRNGGR